MNPFISNAVNERLKELIEEQESIQSTIGSMETELKRLKGIEANNTKIIKDTVDFLKEARKRNAAKSKAPPTQEPSEKG